MGAHQPQSRIVISRIDGSRLTLSVVILKLSTGYGGQATHNFAFILGHLPPNLPPDPPSSLSEAIKVPHRWGAQIFHPQFTLIC